MFVVELEFTTALTCSNRFTTLKTQRMGVLQPFVAFVILFAVAGSSKAASHTAQFNGTRTLENYSICYDGYPKLTVNFVCRSDQLIHIDSVLVSEDDGCHQNASCQVDKTDQVTSYCEGSRGACSTYLGTDYSCSFFNKIEVKFRCIDDKDVYDICPYYRTTQFFYKPVYYMTPNFDEYPMTYDSYAHCECRMSSSYFINIEVTYMNLEKRYSSTKCYDYISMSGDQFCTTTDRYGQPIKKTYYGQSTVKFVSDGSVARRGGWLKISSPNGYLIEMSCGPIRTTTPSTTTYSWTTNWWNSKTDNYHEESFDFVALTGGVIGGVIGITLIIVLIAVFVGRRGNVHVRRARQFRGVIHQPPVALGVVGPSSGAPTYSPPPAYSVATSKTDTSGSTDTAPPLYPAGPV